MPLLNNYIASPGIPGGRMPFNNRIPGKDWFRMRQPYFDKHGRGCVAITDLDGGFTKNDSHGGEAKPLIRAYTVNDLRNRGIQLPSVCNAISLTKEAWIQLDRNTVKTFRQRLTAAADLEAASSMSGFNAMAKRTIEYHAMSDPGEAVVDMDALTDARNDMPLAIIRSLPLPITHADYGFSDRDLQTSQAGDMPFDSTMGEASGRRCAESVEDNVIGNVTGLTYGTQTAGPGTHTGTSTVYGYRTFPHRLTKINMTVPTTTNGTTTFQEVLVALNQLAAQFHYGPFMLYHSTDWSPFMNNCFAAAGGNNPSETLRSMLLKIPEIKDVKRLDRLTATYMFIFVAIDDPNVAQMVNGIDISTIQWDEKGGLDHRYKTLCIKVPRLKADYSSQTGILIATTA
jgi:uncharacterized linocin/CFP29 family protein